MAIIMITKDNSCVTLTVDMLHLIHNLSVQKDYINEANKNIYIYYNFANNYLYFANPVSLEGYMKWKYGNNISVAQWIDTFADGNINPLQKYLQWLHRYVSTYALMYGEADIIGQISKYGHLVRDAQFNGTVSICVGTYPKNLSIVGLQQQIAIDLQRTLQECKLVRIVQGHLELNV